MAKNLRARLARIREQEPVRKDPLAAGETPVHGDEPDCGGKLPGKDWEPAGYECARRTLRIKLGSGPVSPLPDSLKFVVPDFFRIAPEAACLNRLVFFDLETTGLSGGAGTVAFLAAFGRFENSSGNSSAGGASRTLVITQYLLLDYPGECAFLEALLGEFGSGEAPPVIVSYNGKSFDSQIFRTRCLMNGMAHPVYLHADLLHPARRLWKRVLPNCSQAEIETSVLGLDRSGDVPGALAPDIWFDFLRSGDAAALAGICDHNIKDIAGLASIFSAMTHIAADPLTNAGRYSCDLEALALRWRELLFRFSSGDPGHEETCRSLLARSAEERHGRAMYALGRDLLKSGDFPGGRKLLLLLLGEKDIHERVKALAYRLLAVDSEHRLSDIPEALAFTEAALSLENMGEAIGDDFRRRRQRLTAKLLR